MKKIINTYDQLVAASKAPENPLPKEHCVAIGLRSIGIRSAFNLVAVWSPLRKMDPGAHWSVYGAMVFNYEEYENGDRRKAKAAVRERAKAWVAEHTGYTGPWARNKMGELVPASVNKRFPIGSEVP